MSAATFEIAVTDIARMRVYIVAVRMDGSVTSHDDDGADGFFTKVDTLLRAMRTPPFAVDKLILPPQSPYLAQELSRRQDARKEHDRRVSANEVVKDNSGQ